MRKKIITIITSAVLAIAIIFLVVFLMTQKDESKVLSINGTYSMMSDSVQMFTLEITENDGHIIGSHCFTYQGGNRIDCAIDGENTLTGSYSESRASISLTSSYTNEIIKAELLFAKDSLTWRYLSDYADAYFPNEAQLEKQ